MQRTTIAYYCCVRYMKVVFRYVLGEHENESDVDEVVSKEDDYVLTENSFASDIKKGRELIHIIMSKGGK